jgi:hypothetical protein
LIKKRFSDEFRANDETGTAIAFTQADRLISALELQAKG